MDAWRIVIIVFFWNQSLFGCTERQVVALNLNHLSTSASIASLITNAIKNACPLLKDKSYGTATKLFWYSWWIARKGEAIANGNKSQNIPPTFGIGNVVSKLIPHINTCCNKGEEFTAQDIPKFCDLALDPQMSDPNIFLAALIQAMVVNGFILIGVCNQDPLEHQIFAKKMAALGHPPHGLFHAIIGVKAESGEQLENPYPNALINFKTSPDHYPSEAFLKTIQKIAHEKAGRAPIMLIDTEQPAGIEKYGIKFKPLEEFLASGLPNS